MRAFCSACLSAGIPWMPPRQQKYLNQANAIYAQIGQQEAGMVRAAACAQEKRVQQYDRAHQLLLGSGANPVQILGGEDFPQNQTVTLDIKGALFTGHFEGEWFYIESSNDPTATLAIENAWYNEWLDYSLNRDLPACQPVGSSSHVHYEAPVPCDSFCGDFGNPCIAIYDAITITTPSVPTPATPYILKQFWADAGTTVKLYTGVTYIASITPGTVLAVKAYRTYNGARQLVVLTPDMYTVQTVNYGSITAVADRPAAAFEHRGLSGRQRRLDPGLVGRPVRHLPVHGRAEHCRYSGVHHRQLHDLDLRRDQLQLCPHEAGPVSGELPALAAEERRGSLEGDRLPVALRISGWKTMWST